MSNHAKFLVPDLTKIDVIEEGENISLEFDIDPSSSDTSQFNDDEKTNTVKT